MVASRFGSGDWQWGYRVASGADYGWVPQVALSSSSGAELGTSSNPLQITNTNALAAPAGAATYRVGGGGYGAYATPTDLIGIRGSATKTVVVTALHLRMNSTASAINVLSLIKRSTANTSGTLTNPAGIPVDSTQAAATAVVDLYTAAPTTGTSLGNVMVDHVQSAALPNNGGIIGLVVPSTGIPQNPVMLADSRRPIVLRGVNESLYLNYAGAAIPGGWVAMWNVEWFEF